MKCIGEEISRKYYLISVSEWHLNYSVLSVFFALPVLICFLIHIIVDIFRRLDTRKKRKEKAKKMYYIEKFSSRLRLESIRKKATKNFEIIVLEKALVVYEFSIGGLGLRIKPF